MFLRTASSTNAIGYCLARRAIAPPITIRRLSATACRFDGKNSRTDESFKFNYPSEKELQTENPVSLKGKGGKHFRRTLGKFSLEEKTCVITGAARGLGYVMAQAFIESGASVAIIDLNGEEAIKASKSLLEHFNTQVREEGEGEPIVTAHQCNVADPKAVDDIFKEILDKQNNKLDVLVTSAGFTENFPAHEYPFDRMQRLWGVNVDGTYNCSATAARHWIETKQRGNIVMIGSMSGAVVNVPQPQAPYNAAKAAVRQLAASLAVEWARFGIRVNCISPGYMLTALTKKILDEKPELKEKWVSLIPAGRMGDPQDLMGAVVYLASDASLYCTGSDLRIDGGYTVA